MSLLFFLNFAAKLYGDTWDKASRRIFTQSDICMLVAIQEYGYSPHFEFNFKVGIFQVLDCVKHNFCVYLINTNEILHIPGLVLPFVELYKCLQNDFNIGFIIICHFHNLFLSGLNLSCVTENARDFKWSIMCPRFWPLPLHWLHNGRDCVSNHQPHDCLLNRLFRRKSKKTLKLRVTGLCVEFTGAGEFPAQMASNAENVSIRWRHGIIYDRDMWL